MKYFVQLKDDVVFAFHSSSVEEDIPGDNIIEVDSSGEELLNKKFINGNFVDAPLIKYAILDESNDNTIIGIESTYFSSLVKGPIITDDSVKILWKWNGESFVAPQIIDPVPVIVAENTVQVPEVTHTVWTEEQIAAYNASQNQ